MSVISSSASKFIGVSYPSNWVLFLNIPFFSLLIIFFIEILDWSKINLEVPNKLVREFSFNKSINLLIPASLQLISDNTSPLASLGTREFAVIIFKRLSLIDFFFRKKLTGIRIPSSKKDLPSADHPIPPTSTT